MKGTGWIEFKYKLPYSAIEGRTPPYDFPVLVAQQLGDKVSYVVTTAKEVSTIYNEYPRYRENLAAWQAIEEYQGPRG